jgi:CheY-like chemotaxis protein
MTHIFKAIGGGFVFFAATILDEKTLIPIGSALIIAGLLWKFSRIVFSWQKKVEELEDSVAKLKTSRNFESDAKEMIQAGHTFQPPEDHRLSVLVVEDDPADRAIIRHRLADKVDVMEASGLEEAHRIMERTHVDVAFVDLNLGKTQGGDSIAEFVRVHPAAICIALSGTDDPELVSSALSAGADIFVHKESIADKDYLLRQLWMAVMRNKSK